MKLPILFLVPTQVQSRAKTFEIPKHTVRHIRSSCKVWDPLMLLICDATYLSENLNCPAVLVTCKRNTTKYVSRRTCLESTLSVGWHRPLHQSQMSLLCNILTTGLLRKNRLRCSHIRFLSSQSWLWQLGFDPRELRLASF